MGLVKSRKQKYDEERGRKEIRVQVFFWKKRKEKMKPIRKDDERHDWVSEKGKKMSMRLARTI